MVSPLVGSCILQRSRPLRGAPEPSLLQLAFLFAPQGASTGHRQYQALAFSSLLDLKPAFLRRECFARHLPCYASLRAAQLATAVSGPARRNLRLFSLRRS